MGMSERVLQPLGAAKRLSLASTLARRRKKPRRGCGAAASNRARRYLKRRRVPKQLWPILAALFFVTIVFAELRGSLVERSIVQDRRALSGVRSQRNGSDGDIETLPYDTGAALNGEAVRRCCPPVDFQSQRATQVLAFLIRNRGKLDTNVVRKKWDYLDEFSLPLAVYMREVEARSEWSILEDQIRALPLPLKPKSYSITERKLIELMPLWKERGEELLTSLGGENPAPANEPDPLPGDDTTVKPGSPYW